MSMNVDKVQASPAPAHLEDAALQEAETNDVKGDNNLAIHEMTPEEKAEALATAYMSDPGVDYRSRRGIQLICCLLACLVCGTDSGFDSGGECMDIFPAWSGERDDYCITDGILQLWALSTR
jgi:hypothetical protein